MRRDDGSATQTGTAHTEAVPTEPAAATAPRRGPEAVRAVLPPACREVGQLWIDGEWRPASTGATFDTIDPTTGRHLYTVAAASTADVDAAVDAARRASARWWAMDGQDRARILRRIADALRAHAPQLGLLDTLDAGRPIRDTQTRDVERAARIFEFFAGVTDRLRGANIPGQPGFVNLTRYEPYGVVGAIIPWNYPMTNVATKVAPALATGNGVVLKPAEQTPLSALLIAQVAHDAGLPPGLLNVVNGPGDETGRAIVAHPGIPKISFTGSTEVGRLIGRTCGESLKSVTLELGGKTANVVFPDADLAAAADAAVFTAFMNQGQTCTAGTRLLLHDSIADEFITLVRDRMATIEVGDPLRPETQIGPVVSEAQFDRVKSYLSAGLDDGARLLVGGARPAGAPDAGFFVAPALFVDVEPTMRIAREEIFGPVLSVLRFGDEDEAIALANGTPYGLAAAIWTSDVGRVHRFAERAEAGIVWANTVHTLHPGSPYGGYKQSGVGAEMGIEAVTHLMRLKSIWIGTEPWRSPWVG
ncbi:aldehyde dehydrogenase family protein [Micromonospora sp. NPDC049679]|uniref:aldehyde dehydrogenase family protein n=1 Tax=Micromonospora sp. NPDC049679 TaxID=3155920 RepID=UPI0033EF0112